ncbi:UNVERIFIED_CONTAM: hypothetical protein FKN15_009021 [Acipenser sinensis]
MEWSTQARDSPHVQFNTVYSASSFGTVLRLHQLLASSVFCCRVEPVTSLLEQFLGEKWRGKCEDVTRD